jgi:hypothetical protein
MSTTMDHLIGTAGGVSLAGAGEGDEGADVKSMACCGEHGDDCPSLLNATASSAEGRDQLRPSASSASWRAWRR